MTGTSTMESFKWIFNPFRTKTPFCFKTFQQPEEIGTKWVKIGIFCFKTFQ